MNDDIHLESPRKKASARPRRDEGAHVTTSTETTPPGVLMRDEIREQPQRWLDLVASQRDALAEAATLIRTRPDAPIVFVARGSSDHAAMYGQYLASLRLQRAAWLSAPAIASLGRVNAIPRDAIVFGISQSGASPDLITTLEFAKSGGSTVVALTNDKSSGMAQLADLHVDLSAGPELSVAATKTYTAELIALAAIIGQASGNSVPPHVRVAEIAAQVAEGIEAFAPVAHDLAARIRDTDRLMVIGRLLSMSTAREAALKFMETCRLAASGWSAADAKHGPIGQLGVGTPVLLAGTAGVGGDSILQLGRAAADLGADVIAPELAVVKDMDLEPAVGVVPFQMIALELALQRGLDPDRPPGLAKVTQTN
jgi:glucosamine--fructose-6-phosphate aminotransferase (isomerizing)